MNTKRETPQSTKKPYTRPRLTVYGDLRKITAGKGGSLGDGRNVPATKK